MSLGCFVRIGILCLSRIFFVGFGMDFVHAVKADAHVLPGVDELDELFYGAVELPDDVLYCQHHTKCHTAMYYGSGSKKGNEDVLHLVDGDAARLLYLLQIEGLQVHLEQVGLHVLPFPTFALFAPLQFDFLHTAYELVGDVAVTTSLLEILIVQLSAFF